MASLRVVVPVEGEGGRVVHIAEGPDEGLGVAVCAGPEQAQQDMQLAGARQMGARTDRHKGQMRR